MLVGAVTVAGMLLLAGCGGGDPIPTLPPTPTATPIFASEEEALAAAEDAYAAYSEVSALIASEGGAGVERLDSLVTEEQFDNEFETAEYYRSRGVRALGESETTLFELQQVSESEGLAEVVVYVCVDVSRVSIVDASGSDVTPTDRPMVIPLEVVLVGDSADDLLIASSEQWVGSSFC
jgi:hypothetical protein